ncbi:MAG: hypothetical protein QXU28_06325 [Nitrososphaerota archaeon]
MRVLTPIKLTVDISQLKYESSGEPLIDIAPRKMGDSDKCAIEEAVRLKEKHNAHTVVVTVGSTPDHERMVRDAYAMGIDEGYIIEVDGHENLQAVNVGEIIASMAEKTGPYDLIILGAGSLDTHSYTLGPIVASRIGIPIIASVDSLNYVEGYIEAKSVMEDGTYIYRSKPPLVVTVTTEANEPRIPTLKTILKSKKMEVKRLSIEQLGVRLEKVGLVEVKKYIIQRKNIVWDASEDSEKAVDNLVNLLVGEV